MSLSDTIFIAAEHLDSPPPNESCTCDWIISPLMKSAGYQYRDIYSRVSDNNGTYPDYTILPDSEHTWYLEAKAWNVALEDRHAQQALNYANNSGKTWVVLTNGQTWRLYDNRIQGLAAEKLTASADIRQPVDLEKFLAAIGKESVLSGELEQFAEVSRLAEKVRLETEAIRRRKVEIQQLLSEELPTQLVADDSNVVIAIRDSLFSLSGFRDVSASSIAQWFENFFGATPQQPTETAVFTNQSLPKAFQSPPISQLSVRREFIGIDALALKHIDGKIIRPTRLILPDGKEVSVHTWTLVAKTVIAWIGEEGKIPTLPFGVISSGREERYFLDSRQRQTKRSQHLPDQVYTNPTVYADLNLTANDIIFQLVTLCKKIEVSPSRVRVSVS